MASDSVSSLVQEDPVGIQKGPGSGTTKASVASVPMAIVANLTTNATMAGNATINGNMTINLLSIPSGNSSIDCQNITSDILNTVMVFNRIVTSFG